MKAGIAVDNWKLEVFRKRLTDAGFKYEDGGPLPGDATLLTVETQDVFTSQQLCRVIEACQAECARMKRGR